MIGMILFICYSAKSNGNCSKIIKETKLRFNIYGYFLYINNLHLCIYFTYYNTLIIEKFKIFINFNS